MNRPLRLGTRGSQLALRQAEWVARRLQQAWPGVEVELVPITTRGDRLSAAWQSRRTGGDGGTAAFSVGPGPGNEGEAGDGAGRAWSTGVFVRELERALLDGRIDLAVHSLKDVPTTQPEGLVLAAYPVREDPRDALVLREDEPPVASCLAASDISPKPTLACLPPAARVGTSSWRRLLQLRILRPDLQGVELRGNVDTRLARLKEGRVDAVVLAGAGLVRLGLARRITQWLSPEQMVPAPGQGVLAVECRREDTDLLRLLAAIDDRSVRLQVAAERAFLAACGAGCRWPVGALAASGHGGGMRLFAFLAVPLEQASGQGDGQQDGWVWRRASRDVDETPDEARMAQLGAELAREVLQSLGVKGPAHPAAEGRKG